MENKEIAVVTGANGFVGSHLVDLLLDKGFAVRCIVRKSSDLKWLEGKNVELLNGGLLDKDTLRKAFEGASYIYHVAGVVKSKKPEGYYNGNVKNTESILDTALEFTQTIKKIVVVGSLTAAGPCVGVTPKVESDESKPITTYGRSKLQQEEATKKYMDKLPITICRAPAVYGERDTEVFIFFKTFASGLMTKIGFDKKKLSLIHVKDLVNGFYLAAISEKSASQTYYISSEQAYDWDQVGEATRKILGKRALKIVFPHFMVWVVAAFAQFFSYFSSKPATLNIEKVNDLIQQGWVASPAKAIKELGYRQQISLEAGIKMTIDWAKKEGWL